MTYYKLPLSDAECQVFTADLTIDGVTVHARVEYRYFPAPDQWVMSIWDNSSGEQWVNMIPLICSYGLINDLLRPFRHKRNGSGLGSLFVLRNVDRPTTTDPAKGNLQEFQILWGDTYDPS